MTRKELLKNNGYWDAAIRSMWYNKYPRKKFIAEILKLKDELIKECK